MARLRLLASYAPARPVKLSRMPKPKQVLGGSERQLQMETSTKLWTQESSDLKSDLNDKPGQQSSSAIKV